MSGPKYIDRALETSTTTGVGIYTLAGAVVGHQSLAAIGNANTCFYVAFEVDGGGVPSGGWENGIGTWATGGTLARTTILASSNANAAVSWAAGTRRIAVVLPASALDTFVSVYSSINQSILDATTTALTFDTEKEDDKGLHSVSVNTSRITFIVPGVYQSTATVRFAANATGSRDIFLLKNGTSRISEIFVLGSINGNVVNLAGIDRFAAGDYLEVAVYQDSGGALNINAVALVGQPGLQVARIA